MNQYFNLPRRNPKPRTKGFNCMIDTGLSTLFFQDVIESYGELVDFVKFGWGTCLITKDINKKIEILKYHNILFFFGGTLFEKSVKDNAVKDYIDFCHQKSCSIIEISNGTIDLKLDEKCKFIELFAREFRVWSEVGYKDPALSIRLSPSKWIEFINAEIDAGSEIVITEARENGTSGICRNDGEIRYGLIEDIILSGIPIDKIAFEAPNKNLQTFFIQKLGTNVNLANISSQDIIGVESLRLGLRADTLLSI